MPRNSSGVYALPASNPVVTNTTITTLWGNGTMTDLGGEITNSLDRSGRGRMLVPFLVLDGSAAAPTLGFISEAGTGLYRAGSGQLGFAILGLLKMKLSASGLDLFGTTVITGDIGLVGDLDITGDIAASGDLTIAGSTSLQAATAVAPTALDDSDRVPTTAWVNDVAMNANLPSQVGNAGKVLKTDGALASWTTQIGFDSATTATGSVTLTSSSVAAQRIQATALGQRVTLPDATTMGAQKKGAGIFSLTNVGDYTMAIVDAGGTTRGFIDAYSTSRVDLHDISTSAGLWGLENIRRLSISASYANTSLSLGTNVKLRCVPVDADRDVILFGDTTLEAIAYNKTTSTWGSPVQVRATISAQQFEALLVATNKVLAISFNTTAEEATVLSLSNVTITVGTPGTSTIANAITTAARAATPLLVGTSVFMGYVRGSAGTGQGAVQGIAISGAAATIGTDVAIGANVSSATCPHLYVSGSNGVAFVSDGTNFTGRTYTINSTTGALTGGTAGTVAQGDDLIRSVALGSRWLLLTHTNTTLGHLASLSATTITIGASVSNGTNIGGVLDAHVVGSTRVVITGLSTTARFNTFTDTAGVLSAGTAIASTGSTAAPIWCSTTGTTLRYAGSDGRIYSIDASGASPVATYVNITAPSTTLAIPTGHSGAVNSPRSYANLTIGTEVIGLPTTGAQFAGLHVGADNYRIRNLEVYALPALGVPGANDYESYVADTTFTNGFFLKRVQAAQP